MFDLLIILFFILKLPAFWLFSVESVVILLGENNLICLSDSGKLKFIKKLDYTPIAFCNYLINN